jgi:hypothetical protein
MESGILERVLAEVQAVRAKVDEVKAEVSHRTAPRAASDPQIVFVKTDPVLSPGWRRNARARGHCGAAGPSFRSRFRNHARSVPYRSVCCAGLRLAYGVKLHLGFVAVGNCEIDDLKITLTQ